MTEHLTSQPTLRPARPEDFDYCARLYFEELIKELNLDVDAHFVGFRQQWEVAQVRIIALDGTDIGWLQSFVKDETLFLGQLFVDAALRQQGIGTSVVKGLIEEAARADRADGLVHCRNEQEAHALKAVLQARLMECRNHMTKIGPTVVAVNSIMLRNLLAAAPMLAALSAPVRA